MSEAAEPVAPRGRRQALRIRRSGFVVISFFRGDWCPFCMLELKALAAIHPEIE
jgi:peroxiredoxin